MVLESGVDDVHLLQRNPHVGEYLAHTFHALPFFFLSHFFHLGLAALHAPVSPRSFPSVPLWDSAETLHELMTAVRASVSPGNIIGVHLRTTPNVPFLHFGSASPPPNASGASARWCSGDGGRGMERLVQCVARLAGAASLREAEGAAQTVVLVATDNDAHAKDVLASLAAAGGVTVVRLDHSSSSSDRHDADMQSGLLDLELLAHADVLVGSVQSTFSFAAHARGLSAPVYPSFRPENDAGMCHAAGGSESGLLMGGEMPSKCSRAGAEVHWGAAKGAFKCASSSGFCVTTTPVFFNTEGLCLNRVCRAEHSQRQGQDEDEGVWPAQYIASYSGKAWLENWIARYGWALEVDGTASGWPVCRK